MLMEEKKRDSNPGFCYPFSMKSILCAALVFLTAAAFAEQRTWTSSDGSKTFEGTARSYDATRGTVSVVTADGRLLTFPADKLSAADQEWLKTWDASSSPSASAAPDTESEVGSKVAKAKLQKLDGKRYKRAELDKTPEYYLFYYSASW